MLPHADRRELGEEDMVMVWKTPGARRRHYPPARRGRHRDCARAGDLSGHYWRVHCQERALIPWSTFG
jgi:hypothetical protein